MPFRWLLFLLSCFSASVTAASKSQELHPGETRFAEEVARERGVAVQEVVAILDKARYQQSVIDAISRPAELKPWKDYRPIFVTDRRVGDGVAFYRANETLLRRIEAEFGVPAALIVTILGIETNYGRTTGRYRVLDALATLAFYYPPRAPFFRDELKQLLMLRSAHFPYEPEQLMGSYAGAMGWGQFMPTSIAQFARDYDGDGKIDLWNSLPDICASVANYFVAHGWEKGGPVTLRAEVATDARELVPANLEPVYPLDQLNTWGYRIAAKVDAQTPATLIKLDGEQGQEIWITFQNFYAISRYNKSPLYSLAVVQLSEAIERAKSKP